MHAADMNVPGASLAEIRRRQILSLIFFAAGISVLTALAWQSVTGMVSIWTNDSAYNHGFFILPIAGFMAWERRHRLAVGRRELGKPSEDLLGPRASVRRRREAPCAGEPTRQQSPRRSVPEK